VPHCAQQPPNPPRTHAHPWPTPNPPLAGAKALFEATNRGAIHASLLLLYALGGWLVTHGLMSVGVLVSGIGFTFSLMFATQGIVSTLSDLRRASGAFARVRPAGGFSGGWAGGGGGRLVCAPRCGGGG
jgi:hypothetical protein